MNYEQKYNEDYVSFETAKLLKEKGFDWECIGYYVDYEPNDVKYSFLGETNSTWEPKCYSASTLQMTMKWLREFHGLNIYARGVWRDVEVQYGDWEPVVVGYEWFVESLTDDTYSKMSKE